jgi:adenylyl-sulfate kinase
MTPNELFARSRRNAHPTDSSRDGIRPSGGVSRARRWRALEARGATVWLTGLPASGKSTVGAALEERLLEQGRNAYLLDGDTLRGGICSDLGFSPADRDRNVARVGELAQLFADSGAIAVVALVSPRGSARRSVRKRHVLAGLRFIEVFLDVPAEVCAARDPKGLYARARAGELKEFTGVDAPYEPPLRPDLRLTHEVSLQDGIDAILDLLVPSTTRAHV